MNNQSPIFFFTSIADLSDLTKFEVVSLQGQGNEQLWGVNGVLPSMESWPVVSGLVTEYQAIQFAQLCELASFLPEIKRAFNQIPRHKLGGRVSDSYELASILDRIGRVK